MNGNLTGLSLSREIFMDSLSFSVKFFKKSFKIQRISIDHRYTSRSGKPTHSQNYLTFLITPITFPP